eukprot:Tbor_TRINITY_DN5998_c2_g1::TRINITY_DN5998_c2_g1_i1::g.18165::m.18165
MSLLRKKNLFKFVADLKHHTAFIANGKRPLPDILTLSLFLATIKNPDPDIYCSSLEVATYIYGEGIKNLEDLRLIMASRCMTSLPSNGGGEEYYMDGWSVQIGEPERGIKELFNKTPKPQFREQRREGAHRGPGGNDKARVYGAGPIRNDLVRHESQLIQLNAFFLYRGTSRVEIKLK